MEAVGENDFGRVAGKFRFDGSDLFAGDAKVGPRDLIDGDDARATNNDVKVAHAVGP